MLLLFFFGEEDWPQANICCQSSSILCRTPPQHGLMSSARSAPGIQTCEPWAAKVESANLTTMPLGWLYSAILTLFWVLGINQQTVDKKRKNSALLYWSTHSGWETK